MRSVPPRTPRHLKSGSRVHSSPLPVSLPSATIQSAGASPYYEATVGSLVLQPAALHLPFKGTCAYESLHKPALLLDPRMDNWGQGTFTLSVSRLYRRAISISYISQSSIRWVCWATGWQCSHLLSYFLCLLW